MLSELFGLTEQELKDLLVPLEEKPFRAAQIRSWIYEKGASAWDMMTDLSKGLRQKLSESFYLHRLESVKQEESSDGDTTKFLWKLHDGSFV